MKKIALILSLVFAFSLANAQDKDAKTTKVKTEKKDTKKVSKEAPEKDAKADLKKVVKTDAKKDTKTTGDVWCCDSKDAKSYHADKNCGHLKKCKGKMNGMSKKDAEKGGKAACKMCCR